MIAGEDPSGPPASEPHVNDDDAPLSVSDAADKPISDESDTSAFPTEAERVARLNQILARTASPGPAEDYRSAFNFLWQVFVSLAIGMLFWFGVYLLVRKILKLMF